MTTAIGLFQSVIGFILLWIFNRLARKRIRGCGDESDIRRKMFQMLNYVFLFVAAVTMLFPLLQLLAVSLSSPVAPIRRKYSCRPWSLQPHLGSMY